MYICDDQQGPADVVAYLITGIGHGPRHRAVLRVNPHAWRSTLESLFSLPF
jgi:hypothetical protein